MNDLISDVMTALAKKSAGVPLRATEDLDMVQPWDTLPEYEPDGPTFKEGDEVKGASEEEVTPIIPL